MRYRIRGSLPNGQSLIVKVTADHAFAAVTAAGKEIADAGHNLASINLHTVRLMDKAKSSVYVGKVPTSGSGKSKRGRKPKLVAETPTTATPELVPTEPAPETAPDAAPTTPEGRTARRPRSA